MYILERIKNNIIKEVNSIFKGDFVNINQISYPPNREMGDLSLPMFQVAKAQGKSPADLASELVSELGEKKEKLGIDSIIAQGPYLNFKINQKYLSKEVINLIEEKNEVYGKNESGKNKKVMIEYSNANTHKEFHVGHLRNICYGDAVNKILAVNGYKNIPVSYINDFGINVAKTIWGLNEFYKDAEIPENRGEFLGQVYVRSSQEAKNNPLAQPIIQGIMKKIEGRVGEEYKKWEETRQWTIDQFDCIYKELNINFKKTYYESEFIDKGRDMVKELMDKGILKKSEGAVIADLEKEGLGVLVVLRSDSTATYPVADIPLAIQKFKDFAPDVSIYVVDNRQKLYFKQLFKILEQLGYNEKKIHLDYDFVKLLSGMMSSRSGNTITYEMLKKELLNKVKEEIVKRHSDWNEEQIENTAWEISKGAIKFEMLKVGSDQIITFDIEKALDFRGYTAVYLQYTYARINSILAKANAEEKNNIVDFSLLKEEKEYDLVLKMAKYPETVKQAGEKYDPSEIAKYLFELAQMTNDYYHSVNILKVEENVKSVRLALIKNVNQVLKNGLGVLGIEVVEAM